MKTKNSACFFFSLLLLSVSVGCGKKSEPPSSSVAPNPESSPRTAVPPAEKLVRSFRSGKCFLNRIETESPRDDLRAKIYSLATFTLERMRTGTAVFTDFSDRDCRQPLGAPRSIRFEKITSVEVGETSVFVLEKNTVRNRRWYIPAVKTERGFFFAVNHEFENAGPFVVEPVAAEIQKFHGNPTVIGIEFLETDR